MEGIMKDWIEDIIGVICLAGIAYLALMAGYIFQ
jgi:hypothetical protein